MRSYTKGYLPVNAKRELKFLMSKRSPTKENKTKQKKKNKNKKHKTNKQKKH